MTAGCNSRGEPHVCLGFMIVELLIDICDLNQSYLLFYERLLQQQMFPEEQQFVTYGQPKLKKAELFSTFCDIGLTSKFETSYIISTSELSLICYCVPYCCFHEDVMMSFWQMVVTKGCFVCDRHHCFGEVPRNPSMYSTNNMYKSCGMHTMYRSYGMWSMYSMYV